MTVIRKTFLTLVGGGALYCIWLALFLWLAQLEISWMEDLLWFSAPLVTAAGFSLGAMLHDRLFSDIDSNLLSHFKWALVGCILGAVVVIWFGPMLIVFGMLSMGTISVALREVLHLRSNISGGKVRGRDENGRHG